MNSRLSMLLPPIILMTVFGCTEKDRAVYGDQKDFSQSVLDENKLMRYFSDKQAGTVILKYAQSDLDNDGKEDVIIIYRVAREKNEMCVIRHGDSGFIQTNSVPAPVADQMIQFRNIDEKPPLEFILQGRKGANVGYAIFRIEEGNLVDLFGEGMENCC